MNLTIYTGMSKKKLMWIQGIYAYIYTFIMLELGRKVLKQYYVQ